MHFSSRIAWDLEPNRLSRLLVEHPPKFDLTQSNPTAANLDYPAEAIAAAFADPRALQYDPTPVGLRSAREAVSEYYGARVPPDQVLLTASTSEAYSYLFKLLCNPGDQIVVPRPSYPLFEFLAHLESVEVLQYPMHYQGGWFIDVDALAAAISDRTRAIVFVNPNNPTGSFLKSHEYARMASLGVPLIIDEVFNDYAFGPDETRVQTTAILDEVLTFTLSGVSKIVGLPQMKLGWMVLSGPPLDRDAAFTRLELIADTFLSVGSPVQYALPRLLRFSGPIQQQIRARTQRNLGFLRDAVAGSSLQVLDIEAGWYATVQTPRVRTEEEWVLKLLSEAGVLVQPGFFYDFESEAFLILSLLTEPGIFDAGMHSLVQMSG